MTHSHKVYWIISLCNTMNCADALCYCFSSGLQSSKFDRKANMTDKETTKTISVLKCSTLDFFTAVLSGISFPIGFPAPHPLPQFLLGCQLPRPLGLITAPVWPLSQGSTWKPLSCHSSVVGSLKHCRGFLLHLLDFSIIFCFCYP